METTRLLLVEDHPVFLHGLTAFLGSMPTMEVVGTAQSGSEGVALAHELQPDVVLMDLHLPELHGVEATRRIVETSPHIRVLVVSMLDDDDSVFAAMRAGARGYLLKEADQDDIVRAIQAVARGEAIFSPAVARRVLGYFAAAGLRRPVQPFPQLTEREREVLELLARGLGNAVIASRLFISPKTVRNHVSNIFVKLQVADRAEAIVRARDAGLGQPP